MSVALCEIAIQSFLNTHQRTSSRRILVLPYVLPLQKQSWQICLGSFGYLAKLLALIVCLSIVKDIQSVLNDLMPTLRVQSIWITAFTGYSWVIVLQFPSYLHRLKWRLMKLKYTYLSFQKVGLPWHYPWNVLGSFMSSRQMNYLNLKFDSSKIKIIKF